MWLPLNDIYNGSKDSGIFFKHFLTTKVGYKSPTEQEDRLRVCENRKEILWWVTYICLTFINLLL